MHSHSAELTPYWGCVWWPWPLTLAAGQNGLTC